MDGCVDSGSVAPGQWMPHAEKTADGSYTFFSDEFGETFHSRQGAKTEALEKFVWTTDLLDRAQQSKILILDICYGLGYNTAAALESIWQVNPRCQVQIFALEQDLSVPLAALAPTILAEWSVAVGSVLKGLAQDQQYDRSGDLFPCQAILYPGDARKTIQPLAERSLQADAIFLDPFSPRRCPQLWTVDFLGRVAQCLSPEGKLATYCRAAAVRSALQNAGLTLGTLPVETPHRSHEWANGTIAALAGSAAAKTLQPLSLAEQEHLQTRAGIPYQDPTLQDPAPLILARRSAEQERSPLESTTQWRKRWGIDAS
ncbi:MAG: tRNA (5-methylaminomethyl-2-thiouridine)(34)-methyltransferase MnmD [Prochlorotrichaceae cyanobacterium]